MTNSIIDLVGNGYGRLVVISLDRCVTGRGSFWRCLCDCGGERVVRADSLKCGSIRSCGCLHRESARAAGKATAKHGMNKSSTHSTWMQMRRRCNSPNCDKFSYYGGRGIKVCERWDDFKNFLEDMGERPGGMSLDRIDTNGNYEPSNCRWATKEQQANNTRANVFVEIGGEKKTVSQAARLLGIPAPRIYYLRSIGRLSELGIAA